MLHTLDVVQEPVSEPCHGGQLTATVLGVAACCKALGTLPQRSGAAHRGSGQRLLHHKLALRVDFLEPCDPERPLTDRSSHGCLLLSLEACIFAKYALHMFAQDTAARQSPI